jgi:hypothetical protein
MILLAWRVAVALHCAIPNKPSWKKLVGKNNCTSESNPAQSHPGALGWMVEPQGRTSGSVY